MRVRAWGVATRQPMEPSFTITDEGPSASNPAAASSASANPRISSEAMPSSCGIEDRDRAMRTGPLQCGGDGLDGNLELQEDQSDAVQRLEAGQGCFGIERRVCAG